MLHTERLHPLHTGTCAGLSLPDLNRLLRYSHCTWTSLSPDMKIQCIDRDVRQILESGVYIIPRFQRPSPGIGQM